MRGVLTKTLRIISETDIRVDGVQGKHVVAEGVEGEIRGPFFSRDTWHVELKAFLKRNQMIVLAFQGTRKQAQRPDVRQILDSIRFL